MHGEKCSSGEHASSSSQLIDNMLMLCESHPIFCRAVKARCVRDDKKCSAAANISASYISASYPLTELTPSELLSDVDLWRQQLKVITPDDLGKLL